MKVYSSGAALGQALLRFATESGKATAAAMRGALGPARDSARKAFGERGIGRTLLKQRRSIDNLFAVEDAKASSELVVGAVLAKGLAALQDQGGQTKAHVIKPQKARLLSFEFGAGAFASGPLARAKSGQRAFVRQVRHPGARIPRVPFMEDAVEKGLGGMVKAIDEGIQATADRVVG